MKTQKSIFLILLSALLLSGCFLNQELPVEYDYSYKGRFDRYKTYAFMDNENESLEDELIRNSIISHMNFLGYKLKYTKPDLLISYTTFSDSLNLLAYEQVKIETWVESNHYKTLDYDSKRLPINKGTLYLQIMDRKQKSSIWQGYVTNNYGALDFTDRRNVRNAVRSVLNEYQFFAEDFIEQRIENVN